MKRWILLPCAALALFASLAPAAKPPKPDLSKVPGVVIDHLPAAEGVYVGSPSIAILPGGDYVASHDHFGPSSTEHKSALSAVFRSSDRGRTWKKVSEVQGAFWSALFVHRGALYLIGTDRHHGNILIRRSSDGGQNWTTPTDAKTGLLRDNGEYHCGPMPIVEHNGRLWRAFEWRNPPIAWGINYRAGILSVPVDADLLDAANWTFSTPLPSDRAWNGNDMGAWLEGNAVATPEGHLVDILRVQTKSSDEKAAIVHISDDGKKATFDPAKDFVSFPGGAKKFTIRFDPQSKLYWSLVNMVHERHRNLNPGGVRNALALTCSPDLVNWTVRCMLLYHPDTRKHAFQYVDWQFDGDDLIVASRTAYDDGLGGAHNAHDANFLTFHRVANFRRLSMADSVPLNVADAVRHETPSLTVTGYGFEIARLDEGGVAFSNRPYVWEGLSEKYRGWNYTCTQGGEPAVVTVRATRDVTLHVATTPPQAEKILADWEKTGVAFHYTDKGKTRMEIYTRALKCGQELVVPQSGWTGTLVLIPAAAGK